MFKMPSVNKSVNSLNKLKLYVRAVPKFGKTVLFRDMILEEYNENPEKGLLVGVGNEDGYNLLDDLNVAHIYSWQDALDLKKFLIQGKAKGEHEIEFISFDTLDELLPLCEDYVCDLSLRQTGKKCESINGALGGFGRGPAKVKELMKEYISSLSQAGFGVMLIAHTKVKTIVEKGMNSDEGYMQLTSNITNSYEDSISAMFDVICTGMVDKKVEDGKLEGTERKLYFRSDGFVEAGGRFKSNSVPEYIVFESDERANARLFLKTLKDAIRGTKSKPIDDKEFEKMVEEEKKESVKQAQEVLEEEEKANAPSKEEMIEEIKGKLREDKDKKTLLISKIKEFNKKNVNELDEEELKAILAEM